MSLRIAVDIGGTFTDLIAFDEQSRKVQQAKCLTTPADPLLPTTRQRLAIHLLDTVGAWIAGRGTEEGEMLRRLNSAPRTPFPLLSNDSLDRIALGCATTRLTEIDDIHMASCTTPSSVVVPLTLVLATQSPRPDARAFTQALWAGYEVTRVGSAIRGSSIVYQGIWPTYFAAPMGAAAIAARLLGLDAGKTGDAIGIALAMTSGAPRGSSSATPRWLLLGFAARAGCSGALAAAEGYASDRKLLDDDWVVRTPGVPCDPGSLKPYCAAKQRIAAIEASCDLLHQGISPGNVTSLRVAVPPAYAAMIGHRHAGLGRISRLTSAAYNIALAAYEPEGLGDITRPNRTVNSQLAAFMGRVEVVADKELAHHYPERWPARAEAHLKSGGTISILVLDTPGDPSRAFDIDRVKKKFRRYADPSLGRTAADALADACLTATENDEALGKLCEWVKA